MTSFIYPFGGHSTPIDQIIRDSRFTAGRSDQPGYNTQNTDKMSLYIQVMTANTTLGQVQHWVDTAYENHLWLILMFHQIDTTGTAFSVDPTLFAHIVDYVRNKGIATVTMSE